MSDNDKVNEIVSKVEVLEVRVNTLEAGQAGNSQIWKDIYGELKEIREDFGTLLKEMNDRYLTKAGAMWVAGAIGSAFTLAFVIAFILVQNGIIRP